MQSDYVEQQFLTSVLRHMDVLQWSSGVPQKFGGGSFISTAIVGCEPLSGNVVCLVDGQKRDSGLQ